MLWCHDAQTIGLFNDKLKSAQNYTVWSQCTPVPERGTNRLTGGQTSWQ